MLSLFPNRERFVVTVHAAEGAGTNDVDVEVAERVDGSSHPKRRMTWDAAYRAFATSLEQNEHQLSSMAQGLNHGRVLKFYLECRREQLVEAGFLSGSVERSRGDER
jgi:hypothetical protein